MLIDQINEARKATLGAEDTTKRDLLGVLIGDCTRATKVPSDVDVIAIVKKFVENNKIILADKIKMGNTEIKNTATAEQKATAAAEIAILEEFLPQQMTEENVVAEIANAKSHGIAGIGPLMKYFRENFAGLYDGALVSKLVKESL